ncbi:MAG: ATP-grasp domain-containing protein [Acidobacteria bacterium]|nr:ATP-grasp domain-containing protein [Acidobacteriota bacterium]
MNRPVTILAIASYEKGHAFLRQARAEGARVLLLTSLSLKETGAWPADVADEIFYMPDTEKQWNREDTFKAVAYLARTEHLDRIVPLDDFDLELAASLREHLRIAGMGETTVRRFRDKLAMRMCAQEAGIDVPQFVHVLNHEKVRRFTERVAAPWVLKPRSFAGSIGIRKIESAAQLWAELEKLGDLQAHYLLEKYVPGSICHVDTIVYEREIKFAAASGYGRPPMDVAHGGGVFTTSLLERGTPLEEELLELNAHLLKALGMVRGVNHTEYIVAEDGTIFFLETAARVGGAHIADLVEQATGVNLWAEWARIEVAGGKLKYTPPVPRQDYAGLLVTLARQEWPDTSGYQHPEIVWRLNKKNHVGFIVRAESHSRVREVLDEITGRVQQDFWAYAPPKERPVD